MLTRSRVVADRVRERILSGEYQPGMHLQEIPLATAMDASRTPIRAALMELEKEGLLSYVPKRGYEVRRFDGADIADMYSVRAVLEAHAASQCAMQPERAPLLAKLQDCLRIGDAILARRRLLPADLAPYREMNHRFHEAILQHSGSRATMAFVGQMRQIPLLSDRIVLWHDFRLIDRSHDDHHRICDAVAAGDGGRAGAIVREHVSFMGSVVRARFEQQKGLSHG